jgi:hypothetical protein
MSEAKFIARRFHEVYEELAPAHGWQTQERSAVRWEEVPIENRSLMVEVVARLLDEGAIRTPDRTSAENPSSDSAA